MKKWTDWIGGGRSRRENVVVIGAGQAGLATSAWLSRAGTPHVVLERSAVGASWWEKRWNSFRLVTPNAMLKLPGARTALPPEGFLDRDGVIDHLATYAHAIAAPVETGVEVRRLAAASRGWRLETNAGRIEARAVIVAAGTFHRRIAPAWAAALPPRVLQIGALEYRAPAQLPAGAVLVIGSGQSGAQIAHELHAAGRTVHLATGATARLPRRHRGRDTMTWLAAAGEFDRTLDAHPLGEAVRRRANAHVAGGASLDLRRLGAEGVHLYGRAIGGDGARVSFAPHLARNLAAADQGAARFQQIADDYIAATGQAATDERERPHAWTPAGENTSLDLEAERISTVLWANGLAPDFSWIDLPLCDALGWPRVRRGLTDYPGLAFVGLHWMHRWSSALFLGVGRDARFVVSRLEPPRSRFHSQPSFLTPSPSGGRP